jgi:hypothetical protein
MCYAIWEKKKGLLLVMRGQDGDPQCEMKLKTAAID